MIEQLTLACFLATIVCAGIIGVASKLLKGNRAKEGTDTLIGFLMMASLFVGAWTLTGTVAGMIYLFSGWLLS